VTKSDDLKRELFEMTNPVVMRSKFNISKYIAKRITGPDNQSEAMMTVGSVGTGKSSSNITLAINTAIEVAKIKGKHWTHYFSMDNVGILTKEEIYRVIQNEVRYSITLCDDVGAAYNARKWQSEGNIMMNDLQQVSRTENQCLLMTLPDSILIDKVPRVLVHHVMTMDRPQYDKGVSIGKFFSVDRDSIQNKTYHKYVNLDGVKFQKVLFARPPPAFMEQYEKVRRVVASKMKQDALEAHLLSLEEAKIPMEDRPLKVTKKDRVVELHRDFQAGIYPSFRDAIKIGGKGEINTSYAYNVVAELGL